jgi:DNA-binding NarL/FixJ family response regulator
MKAARIVLADDHTIVAQGLRSLLEDHFDLLATAADGRTLVALTLQMAPDVVITDISMPVLNGLDAVRQIKAAGSNAKIVILTMHSDSQLAVEAFRAGASAYLLKQSAGEELIAAIHEVLRGRPYVSPLLSKDLVTILMEAAGSEKKSPIRLTSRQREVLQLIAEGKTMKEIASILQVSTRTAETHKYEMMQSLGIKTTAELVHYAIKIGLVPLESNPS